MSKTDNYAFFPDPYKKMLTIQKKHSQNKSGAKSSVQGTPFHSTKSYKFRKEFLLYEDVWIAYEMVSGCVEWFRCRVLKVKKNGVIKIEFYVGVQRDIKYVDQEILCPKKERKTWMFDEANLDPNKEFPKPRMKKRKRQPIKQQGGIPKKRSCEFFHKSGEGL